MLPGNSGSNATPTGNNGKSYRPRRPHSKTRTGCRTCRQRKVKCDETRPVCKNCSKRGLHSECEYRDTVVWVSQPPVMNTSGSTSKPRGSGAASKSSNATSPASSTTAINTANISHDPPGAAITGPASPADSYSSTTNTSVSTPYSHVASPAVASPAVAHAPTPLSPLPAYSFTPAASSSSTSTSTLRRSSSTTRTSTPGPTSVPFLLNPHPPSFLTPQTTNLPSGSSFFTAPGPLPTPPIYPCVRSSTIQGIAPAVQSSIFNLTSLRLFHLFTTRTSKTFCTRTDVQALWKEYAPSLALRLAFTGGESAGTGTNREFLLHSMLSVAALNAASMAPDREERDNWIMVAREEHQLSLEGFRDAIARHAEIAASAATAAGGAGKGIVGQQSVFGKGESMSRKGKEVRSGRRGTKRRRSEIADQSRNEGTAVEATSLKTPQGETDAVFFSSALLFIYSCSLATLGIQDDEDELDDDEDDDDDDSDDDNDGHDDEDEVGIDIEKQYRQGREDKKDNYHRRAQPVQTADVYSPPATSSGSTPAAQILTPPSVFATHAQQDTQIPSQLPHRQSSSPHSRRTSSTFLTWLPLLRGNSAVVQASPQGEQGFLRSKLAPLGFGLEIRSQNHPYTSVLSNLSTELMKCTLHPHLPHPTRPLSRDAFCHATQKLNLAYERFYSFVDPVAAALSFAAQLPSEFTVALLGDAGAGGGGNGDGNGDGDGDGDGGTSREVFRGEAMDERFDGGAGMTTGRRSGGGYIGGPLEDRDPRALIIMAYFLVLIVILDFVLPGEKEPALEGDEDDGEQDEVDNDVSCDDGEFGQDGESEDEDAYTTYEEHNTALLQSTIIPLIHTPEAHHRDDSTSPMTTHKKNSPTITNTNLLVRGRNSRKVPYSRMRGWWISRLGRKEIREIASYLRAVDEEECKIDALRDSMNTTGNSTTSHGGPPYTQQYRHEENYSQYHQQQNQQHHLPSSSPLPRPPHPYSSSEYSFPGERESGTPTHTYTTRLYPPPTSHPPPPSQTHLQLPHQSPSSVPYLQQQQQPRQPRKLTGRWSRWMEWPLAMIKGDTAARMAYEYYETHHPDIRILRDG